MEIEKTKKRIITLLQQIGGSTLCAEICKEVAHENYEKALELSEKLPIFGYGHKEKLDKVKFLLQSLCSDDAEILTSEDGVGCCDSCDCDGECRCDDETPQYEDETPQVDENVFDREVLEQPTEQEEELPSEIYVEASTDSFESTEQEEECSDDGECSDEE